MMPDILIADDDLDLLELVGDMVNFNNMRSTCISNGAEVLPKLEMQHFDLLLMDIYMGSYDGRILASQIKNDSRFSHIPLLLYSAGEIDPESITLSGADGFIKKPFDMMELIARLQHLLKT